MLSRSLDVGRLHQSQALGSVREAHALCVHVTHDLIHRIRRKLSFRNQGGAEFQFVLTFIVLGGSGVHASATAKCGERVKFRQNDEIEIPFDVVTAPNAAIQDELIGQRAKHRDGQRKERAHEH